MSNNNFKVSRWLSNPHLQTILPHFFRSNSSPKYTRERITTLDRDFIDLDWSTVGSNTVCLILHGLESSSNRGYIYGTVNALKKEGYDCVVMNFRGCSGTPNLNYKAYNSGDTGDLEFIINKLTNIGTYSTINLIGFSLGGNVALKYAGETSDKKINKLVGISVPCDLSASTDQLERCMPLLYQDRFLKSLKIKLLEKEEKFPDFLNREEILNLKTIKAFDNYYTAPAFGFNSADHYYKQSSSKPFIRQIMTPTLIINAQDDPFMTIDCMPIAESESNPNVTFLNPKHGGHVGFCQKIKEDIYWHEKKIISFLKP